MLAVLIQIDGWDPASGAAVTLRAGNHDDPALCHLDGQIWWPAISKAPTLRYDLFDGAFGGSITTPSASLTLQAEPWPNLGRYMLADARLRLWTAEFGATWSGFTLRFDGRVTDQPKLSDGQAQIGFAVDDRWLDQPLLATYAGTTGAEGPAAMKGQAKPLALGAPRYVAGKLVDPTNSVFHVSAYGAIEGVTAALERLARYGAAAANYASHAALVGATIAAGTWATCLAEGKVRFGAPPTGQVSFLVQGDKAGTDGWARKPGQLIRRLALLSGGTGKIDDASLNALDMARPYNLSLYLEEQTTARDLIQRLAASVNAVAGVSWLGKLFVAPVAIGATALTLAADGSALPPVSKVEQLEQAAPFKKLALTAERTWQVHALADIAFTATLIDMGAFAAGTTYREGNIIQDQGSSWLYINPAPTTGNAPPALPTTENGYWRVLARAGEVGETGPQGPSGIPGAPGANGQTSYTHIAYADSADGSTNFTTGPAGGHLYIGIYQDFTAGGSGSYGAYYWSRWRGADGSTGFPGAPGSNGQTPYTHFAYASSADGSSNFHVSDPAGRIYLGVYTDYVEADSNSYAAYIWSLIKGADGTPGSPGPPGANAIGVSLSTYLIPVQADYAGATKAGQVPRYATLTVESGGTNVTGSCSVSLSPTGGIAASYSGGTITITAADAAGYVDVGISYGGAALATQRLQVTRTLDNPPPASQTNGGDTFTGIGLPTSTSYSGPYFSTTVLKANASGQLIVSAYLSYTAETPATGSRSHRANISIAYRAAGGGAWSYFGDAAGSLASSPFNNDPSPGTASLSGTITGLTAAATYEFGMAIRKISGSAASPIGDGSYGASQ